MLEDKTLVPLYNRVSNGEVIYRIDEIGVRRSFESGETKKVTMEEIRKLSWVPGGTEILRDCLIIQNEEAVEEILGQVEPEYYYTKQDVINILVNGTLDELDDCLTFAPLGVVDLVQDVAISMNLNDMSKRKLIQEKTGRNIDRAIRANEEVAAAMKEADKPAEEQPKVRKASAPSTPTEPSAPQRKSAAPKYKVIES